MRPLLVLALTLLAGGLQAAELSSAFSEASRASKPQCELKDRTMYCYAYRQKGFSMWSYGDCDERRVYAEISVNDARRGGIEAEVKTRTQYCVGMRPPGFSTWSYTNCSYSQAEAQATLTAKRYAGACAD